MNPTLEERVMLNELTAWLQTQSEPSITIYYSDSDGVDGIPMAVPEPLADGLTAFCERHVKSVFIQQPSLAPHWSWTTGADEIVWTFHADGKIRVATYIRVASNQFTVFE